MRQELNVGLFALATLGLASSCVRRECTPEERDAAGLGPNEDCRRFVSTRTFEAARSQIIEVDWSPGTDINVDGAVGEIVVESGDEGVVEFAFTGQVDLASDRSDEVVERTLSLLELGVTDRDGVIGVEVGRGQSQAALGARLVLRLPRNFDAALSLRQSRSDVPGDIVVEELYDTAELVVRAGGAFNEVVVVDPGRLETAQINGDDDIRTGPFGSRALFAVVLNSTRGDIQTGFVRAPAMNARIFAAGAVDMILDDRIDGVLQIDALRDEVNQLPVACSARNSLALPTWVCGDGSDYVSFDVRGEQVTVDFR